MRYLSLEWIAALSEAVGASVSMHEAAQGHDIAVTQVVTGTPEGDVTYHLSVADGAATFGAGPADPEDVRMVQDWSIAVGVAMGTVNAQEAFITGRIRLSGDQQKLMDAQGVFKALDAVFNEIRDRTVYE